MIGKYDRPDRTFVVVGMSRSGTSLLSKLITENVPNAVCVNELVGYAYELRDAICDVRKRILNNRPIPVKLDNNGNITSNPWRDGATMTYIKMDKRFNDDVAVGVKGILTLFDGAKLVLSAGYKLIIVIRDPVYTISAWNDPVASMMDVCRITDDNMHGFWREWKFDRYDKIGRQAEVWEHYAKMAVELEGESVLVKYEDIVDDTYNTMVRIAEHISCPRPDKHDLPNLDNMNRNDRYGADVVDRVKLVVDEVCHTRKELGYS